VHPHADCAQPRMRFPHCAHGLGTHRVEVTYTPGGAAYVAATDDAPSFGNYGFGTSVTFNLIASSGLKVRSAR
jgi:hypothetical protein